MSTSQILRRSAALALCGIAASAAVASAATKPMPATIAPQNPSMAANPSSNIHNDTWMTDAYQHAGPVGRKLETKTGLHAPSLCGSLGLLRRGAAGRSRSPAGATTCRRRPRRWRARTLRGPTR